MKRHHPYGGYDETARGRGRRGGRNASRGRPPAPMADVRANYTPYGVNAEYGVSYPSWGTMPFPPMGAPYAPFPMPPMASDTPQPMYGTMPMPWGMPYGMPMPGSPYGPPVPSPDQRRDGRRSDGRRSDTYRGGRNRRGPVHPRPSKSVYQPDPDAERPEDSKPCRTLFVRNVAFEVNVHQFREQFEQFGEIKTWFDLIQRRGLLFVTYFDTRAAQRAKEEMNQRKLYGRVLDVHYSLPKDEDQQQHCDREKNQGTLFALVRGATEPVTDENVRALFAPFGEIREIRPYKDKENTRFVEYWDSRACVAAYDQLNETAFLGGELLLKFAWDLATVSLVTDAKNRNEAKAAAEARAREGQGSATPVPTEPSTAWPATSAASVHGEPIPLVPGPTGDRLEQAQKVQQLLATLQNSRTSAPHVDPPPPESAERSSHATAPLLDNAGLSTAPGGPGGF